MCLCCYSISTIILFSIAPPPRCPNPIILNYTTPITFNLSLTDCHGLVSDARDVLEDSPTSGLNVSCLPGEEFSLGVNIEEACQFGDWQISYVYLTSTDVRRLRIQTAARNVTRWVRMLNVLLCTYNKNTQAYKITASALSRNVFR